MILISCPSHDTVMADFCLSLVNLSVYSALCNVKLRIQSPRSSILPQSRNLAVRELMSNKEYTHLFFLDSDMAFPADALVRLLRHDKELVAATYARRKPSNGDSVVSAPEELYDKAHTDLIEVPRLPTGCMLIRRDVIERLPMPVFEFGWNPEGDGFEVGEDMVFCDKVRALGVQPYLDPAVSRQLIHLGVTGFAMRGSPVFEVMDSITKQ